MSQGLASVSRTEGFAEGLKSGCLRTGAVVSRSLRRQKATAHAGDQWNFARLDVRA